MRKKNLFILLLIFQFSILACSNQGAFEVRENSNGRREIPPNVHQLFSKTNHILTKLSESANPLEEKSLLSDLSQSLSEINAVQEATKASYQIQVQALESKWKRLDCVEEDHSDFSSLSSFTQEQCREIKNDQSKISNQRREFHNRFGSVISALSTFSEEGDNLMTGEGNTPMAIIQIAGAITDLQTAAKAWGI